MAAQCVADIRAQMSVKDINATGKTSRSLAFEAEQGHVVIYAEGEHAPVVTLQRGSGPHVNAEPTGFVEAIREWVGVRFPSLDERRSESLTWAVVTKIRREGTRLYRETGETGVPRDVYSSALERLEEQFAAKVGADFSSYIVNSIDKTI